MPWLGPCGVPSWECRMPDAVLVWRGGLLGSALGSPKGVVDSYLPLRLKLAPKTL